MCLVIDDLKQRTFSRQLLSTTSQFEKVGQALQDRLEGRLWRTFCDEEVESEPGLACSSQHSLGRVCCEVPVISVSGGLKPLKDHLPLFFLSKPFFEGVLSRWVKAP